MQRESTGSGRRIHVIGNSCSGKSTLGRSLADGLGIPFVELDALNWLPGWVGLNDTDPAEFERRIREATAGDAWVVAGSYSTFSKKIFWPRAESVIWLDLPMLLLIRRMCRRTWVRWRTRELLWGTNRENFWSQIMVWRGSDSLLWWIVTQHHRKRVDLLRCRQDPQWQHIDFIRVRSEAEANALLGSWSGQ